MIIFFCSSDMLPPTELTLSEPQAGVTINSRRKRILSKTSRSAARAS
jgi:hypothetical protein